MGRIMAKLSLEELKEIKAWYQNEIIEHIKSTIGRIEARTGEQVENLDVQYVTRPVCRKVFINLRP
jgi:hypothetical protein